MHEVFIIREPKYEGYLKICGDFHVFIKKKPNWLHRKMIKLILGFEWVDYK